MSLLRKAGELFARVIVVFERTEHLQRQIETQQTEIRSLAAITSALRERVAKLEARGDIKSLVPKPKKLTTSKRRRSS